MCQHHPRDLYTWTARDDSAPNGRVLVITCKACHSVVHGGVCLDCENTGWRDVKRPRPGQTYCTCEIGRQKRREARTRAAADWQAANDAGLWNRPDDWPW